ncbi:protein FAM50A-like [Corticium candelabrum]|uniref:protein FAM50A-like n=1 Tax=Corticium candelabrum TaxID=121492 RepID=UPI002E263BAF|nr:protein FAM50A-like [Corticium candelabrum]
MAHYKGAAAEGARAVNLMKKREQAKQEIERLKQKIADENDVRSGIDKKFDSHYDFVENQLKNETIGLVTLNEMKEKREAIVKEHEKKLAAKVQDNDESKTAESVKKKKKRVNPKSILSFAHENEDEEEEEFEAVVKKRKVGKNPDVDTSFLPDRDREEEERRERETLRQEWESEQEKLKDQDIEITYSYWDGSGHRRTVVMKKGNSIGQFLSRCLQNLRKDFPELRGASTESMMYIKEDLIIPHHHTFYEFIVTQARGKSGPLFSFDVHDDVRLVSDARKEKDESHAGKVVLRSWYERNKHIFPASRWEPYDPQRKWEKYTIGDGPRK